MTGGGSNDFDGNIAYIRIWEDERTLDEIRDNMVVRLNGDEDGLVGYWEIDDAAFAAGVVTDLTANGNNGTVVGADWIYPLDPPIATSILGTVEIALTNALRLSTHGYATPAAQIADGEPLYCQPAYVGGSPTGTSDVWQFYDVGSVVDYAWIDLAFAYEDIAGEAAVTIGIATKKLITDSWSWLTGGTDNRKFGSDFRYVAGAITFVSTAGETARLTDMQLRVTAKEVQDSGVQTVSSNPETVTFAKSFGRVYSIVVTPQGTTDLNAVVNFTDIDNPTSFTISLFDTAGSAATGDVRWVATGV